MSSPISLLTSRTYVDVPKNINPLDLMDFLIYINMKNGRQYKYEHEIISGQKMRIFFDVNKRNFKYCDYDEYLSFREQENIDARNTD